MLLVKRERIIQTSATPIRNLVNWSTPYRPCIKRISFSFILSPIRAPIHAPETESGPGSMMFMSFILPLSPEIAINWLKTYY